MGAMTEGTVRRAGGRALFWRANGEPHQQVVLWLHGSTGSSLSAPVLPGFRVLAYDRPGFGRSDPLVRRSLLSDADDCVSLLDAHGASDAVVLAYSGGAAVAYTLAARHRRLARALAVLSGTVPPATPPPDPAQLRQIAEALEADPAAAVGSLATDAPPDDLLYLTECGTEGLAAAAREAFSQGSAGWMQEVQIVRTAWPVAGSDVRVPVVLWHGEQDVAVPLNEVEAWHRSLPDSSLRAEPHAGHLGTLRHALDAVQAAVR